MPNRAQTLLQRLEEKARRGNRGDPIGTVALYGPTDQLATKLVVGFSPNPNDGVTETKNWVSEHDVRTDAAVLEEALAYLTLKQVRSVVMTAGIYGCPHEESIDYPEGASCQVCTFWKDRKRDVPLLG